MISTVNSDLIKMNPEAFTELEKAVWSTLETYSNVHRGSGHKSMISTHLFDHAREIVLDYLDLQNSKYAVIFCNSRRSSLLRSYLKPESFKLITSSEIGLPVGVHALAAERRALPKSIPFQTGGGTTRLVGPDWEVWAAPPERFEAGTPAIVNVVAFAKALLLVKKYGSNVFRNNIPGKWSVRNILHDNEPENDSGNEPLTTLRRTLIGRDFPVPTTNGVRPYVNLDYGASTPAFEPVWEAFRRTLHQASDAYQEIISSVRSVCSDFLGAPQTAYEVIFTSNTTEAINLAAENIGLLSGKTSDTVIVNSILEHNSNDLPWRKVHGSSLIRVGVDEDGIINLQMLEGLLKEYNTEWRHGNQRIRLVAVSGASNVLGIFNDLKEISRIAHNHDANVLVDAAQMVAHREVLMEKWGIDYLAFSAHKAYAPFGTGVLVARRGLLNFSAENMELIRSSGEENAAGIAALGKSLQILKGIGFDAIMTEERRLTALALRQLSEIDGLTIYGIKDPATAAFAMRGGVIVFSMKGAMPNVIARKLAQNGGIGVRYGCHCAHILIKHILKVPAFLENFQRVMVRMLPKMILPGVVRISMGIGNTEEDISRLVTALKSIKASATTIRDKEKVSVRDLKRQMADFVRDASRRIYYDTR